MQDIFFDVNAQKKHEMHAIKWMAIGNRAFVSRQRQYYCIAAVDYCLPTFFFLTKTRRSQI